jgi:hypothetical protein
MPDWPLPISVPPSVRLQTFFHLFHFTFCLKNRALYFTIAPEIFNENYISAWMRRYGRRKGDAIRWYRSFLVPNMETDFVKFFGNGELCEKVYDMLVGYRSACGLELYCQY